MSINGYCGICAACFNPIKNGDLTCIRPNGRHFHQMCIEQNSNNYYVKLEKRLLKKQKKKELTKCQDME